MSRDGDNHTLSERIQALCAQLSTDLNSGQTAHIEDLLTDWQGDERSELLRQLLGVEIEFRRTQQEDLSVEEFVNRFPNDSSLVQIVVEQSEATIGDTLLHAGSKSPQDFGEYTVLGKIGEGGMGAVYKARHKRMDRVVAIKLLPPKALDSPDAVKRFEREVKAAAKLEHPNVVTAYDAGEANGHHFLVMRYVDGQDLSAYVKQHGPVPVAIALNYIAQTANGLEYAHDEGIIHRDIKPSNLLLDRKATVKVLDMGLARLESEMVDHSATELTQSGTAMGTVDYMAPEQSADAHTADVRSDIYSLGCTMYYLLTGRSVYGGATLFNRMLAHRDQPIPSLTEIRPDIPPAVNDLFQKMVAKQPADRYQTMTEVIQALRACGIGEIPQPSGCVSGSSFPTRQSAPPTVQSVAPTATHVQPDIGDSSQSETSISAINQQTIVTQDTPEAESTSRSRNRSIPAAIGALAILLIGSLIWFNRPVETEQGESAATRLPQSVEDHTPKNSLAKVEHATKFNENDYALEFDGKTSYVDVSSLVLDGTQPLTVEVKIDVFTFPHLKDSQAFVINAGGLLHLKAVGDKLWSASGRITSSRNLVASQQSKRKRLTLTVVYDLETIRLFVDGKSVNEVVVVDNSTGDIVERIAGTPSGGIVPRRLVRLTDFTRIGAFRGNFFFHGIIDEVCISNVARYDKDFTPAKRFEADEHTLALYHFDEGQGNVLKDSSGNGHNGKIFGAKWVRMDDELNVSESPKTTHVRPQDQPSPDIAPFKAERFRLYDPASKANSTAVVTANSLTVKSASGTISVYKRDAKFDSEDRKFTGYSNDDLAQAIRWPVSGKGHMQIGRGASGNVTFRPSRMEISAIVGVEKAETDDKTPLTKP